MKRLSILLLIILSIASCVSKSEEEKEEGKTAKKDVFLPQSTGEPGEIVIVMDKDKWDGELGKALKEVFLADFPGLTRPEPLFTTRVIEPFQFNRIFKLSRNIVYVTTLDGTSPADRQLQSTLSENSKERINTEPDLFMNTSDDQYAKRQKVLFLFGKTQKDLINNINENQQIIRNYFNMAERERLATDIRASIQTKGISSRFERKYGYYIKIPVGYEVAMDTDDFMWSRYLPGVGPSKNIFVYFKDYESQDEFSHDNIIKLRNQIGKEYIYGDPENPESFMITETQYMQPIFRDINLHGRYTVETRGAWKTNNFSVGGTFISYTFVDQASNRLYYVEGFVIHPNEEHRELIREMESIISTFKPLKDESQAVAN